MAYKTANDMLQRLIDYQGGDTSSVAVSACRRAIVSALDEISTLCRWKYLHAESLIHVPAAYDTGTITYVASTRTVTLTDGVFPTWAADGYIIFDDQAARIESRTSDTVIVLEAITAPIADEATGITYVVFKETFDLPDLIWQIGPASQVYPLVDLQYIEPTRWHEFSSAFDAEETGGSRPLYYTVLGDTDAPNGYSKFKVAPFPDEAVQIRFNYLRTPRPITVWDSHPGTISVSGTTVTGVGTAFTSAMVGSVLRVSTDATHVPSDLHGEYPYTGEVKITGYTSATSLAIASTVTASGKKYVISDPVDVDYLIMWNLLFCCALKNLSEYRETEQKGTVTRQYRDEIRRARGADYVSFHRGRIFQL